MSKLITNYRAELDFIEFQIETQKPTLPTYLKQRVGLPYVLGLNSGPGNAGTIFKFRLYDLDNWSLIENKINQLKTLYPLMTEPRIIAMEVSFDTYIPGATHKQLIKNVVRTFQMLQNPPSENCRMAGRGAGNVINIGSPTTMERWLEEGRSIYIGNQTARGKVDFDPVSMRFYLKTHDRNQLLPPHEHRARYEVTLQGDACPCQSLEELYNFDFRSVRKHFFVNKPKDKIHGLMGLLVERMPQVGKMLYQKRKKGGGVRKWSRCVTANTEVNTAVYEQLRCLDKRFHYKNMRNLRNSKALKAA